MDSVSYVHKWVCFHLCNNKKNLSNKGETEAVGEENDVTIVIIY